MCGVSPALSWVLNEIYGPNGFPLTHDLFLSLSFSLTFPLNQTISIVSQISYKLSDLIYIHISIINYHSYVVSSRIDLVVYCYWILWLLRNKTSIISTVITHNQQKKMYTQLKFFCVLKTNENSYLKKLLNVCITT